MEISIHFVRKYQIQAAGGLSDKKTLYSTKIKSIFAANTNKLLSHLGKYEQVASNKLGKSHLIFLL